MAFSAPASDPSASATQRRIWSLAWPIMLSNITVPLLGLVDTAILGHLEDAVHLGAVAVGSQLFILLFWSFSFLRMGTTAMTARAGGRWQHDGHDQRLQPLQHSLWLLLPLIPLVMLLAFSLWPLALPLMSDNAQISQGAMQYLNIRVWGTPAVLGQYVLLGWFIGLGKTRIPLLLLTITNLLNALLNYLFVYQLGMTSDGVALGTVIAEYSTLLLGLLIACRLGLTSLAARPRWSELKPLLNINRHLFARTLILLSTFAFFTAQGAQQGELILATNAMLISLLLLIANALDGFAHAAEVMVGEALGARRQHEVRQAIRLTGINSLLMALLLCLLFWLSGSSLFRLLTDNPELLPLLHQYQWFLILLPLAGMPGYWLDGIFIGAAQSRAMRNGMLLAVVLVFYPLWWLFSSLLPASDLNLGLWWAFYAFTLGRAVFLLNGFLTLYKKPEKFMQIS